MTNTAIIAAVIMLVLLFLKVPVFVSVISATVAYFTMNPSFPQQILAQRWTEICGRSTRTGESTGA